MTVLGLETSTVVCSVGLVSESGIRYHKSISEPHIHSEKLLSLVEDLIAEAGIELSSLNAVAISIGPGSFTGLRIGLSSAKGLCYALEKPLVVVSTFHAIAAAVFLSKTSSGKILVALDAKKGDFYVGLYSKAPQVTEIEGAGLAGIEEILQKVRSENPDFVVTDQASVLQHHMAASEALYLDVSDFCRGDMVAEQGLRKLRRGETADLSATEPLYLKDFVVHGGGRLVSN